MKTFKPIVPESIAFIIIFGGLVTSVLLGSYALSVVCMGAVVGYVAAEIKPVK